jgi:hypothetical protein
MYIHVCITIYALEKQQILHILSVCVCSISYPACKAHRAYIVICGLSGFTIYLTLSHKWFGFWEKVIEHKMCVLIFCAADIYNILCS